MSKKVNSIKIEKIPLKPTPLDVQESDNEIELKNMEKYPPVPPLAPATIAPPIKEKKKINISDEERERRRQRMLQTREKKMENANLRQLQQEQYLKSKKAEMDAKIIKKAEQLRKKQEKEMLQYMMYQEMNNKSKLDDDYDEYEEEEKPKHKPKPRPQPSRPRPPSVQQQPVYQAPVYQAPAFRWV